MIAHSFSSIITFRINMTHENLIDELNQIERNQLPAETRPAFLSMLRTRPSADYRDEDQEWRPGAIYFHALQDLVFSVERGVLRDEIQESQACFTRDLDQYFRGLPQDDTRVRPLLQTIFDVGTSFVWEDNMPAVRKLYTLFDRADEQVIRPWVIEVTS